MSSSGNLHVVILAGSEDKGLAPMIRAISGRVIPKPFAFIAGNGSLLQQTVAAYAPLASPDRLTVVVSADQEDLARTQLHEWPGTTVMARQRDRGPGLDIMLALGRIVAKAPRANVLVTSADHYVPRARAMADALAAASAALTNTPVILAGAAIDHLEQGSLFIVPGKRRKGGIHTVAGLIERDSPALGERVRTAAGLWYTSTFIAQASVLWHMGQQKMPAAARILSGLWSKERPAWSAIDDTLAQIPNGSYGEALWAGAKALGVAPVSGSGWNDWSTPERVLDSVRDGEDLQRLLARIFRRQLATAQSASRRPVEPMLSRSSSVSLTQSDYPVPRRHLAA